MWRSIGLILEFILEVALKPMRTILMSVGATIEEPFLYFEFVNEEPVLSRKMSAAEFEALRFPEEEKVPINLLHSDEVNHIKGLLESLSLLNEPISAERKKKLESIHSVFSQYNALLIRRETVLASKEEPMPDEMIAYTFVEQPIVLTKQWEEKGQWFVVPMCSYVTDKVTLMSWFSQQGTHPLNRDLILTPGLYKGMNSRYVWYELTEHSCFIPDLNDAATELRLLVRKLVEPVQVQVDVRVSEIPQSLFQAAAINDCDLTEEELDRLASICI